MKGTLKIKFFVLLIAFIMGGFFILGASPAQAANLSSLGDGNWHDPNTWSTLTGTGTISYVSSSPEIIGTATAFTTELAPGSIIISASGRGSFVATVASISDNTHLTLTSNAGITSIGSRAFTMHIVPRLTDAVSIANGDKIAVGADANCASLSFPISNTSSSSLDINAGTLTVLGAVTIPRAASPAFNIVNVGSGNLQAGSIAFTNAGTASAKRHQLLIGDGTVTVSGDVTHLNSSGSATITFLGNGLLKLAGAFLTSSTATVTAGSGTIEYNGLGLQTVGNFNYHNLILSGMLVKTMLTGTTVSGNLSIAPSGSALAKLVMGQDISAGTLLLGGVARASGIWGSSDSTATYTDDNYFAPSSGRVVVSNGSTITPSVSEWPSASDIVYGQSLAASSLSGGASSVNGSFSFVSPSSTQSDVGDYEAEVIFTPSELGLYGTVTGHTQILVKPRPVTATVVADNKVYDGTDQAAINSCNLVGVINLDNLLCVLGSARFADRNVGLGKVVTASGLSLAGLDARKYLFLSASATTNADISKRTLTVSANTDTKIYDKNTSSVVSPTLSPGELASGDSATWTQAFADEQVGNAKVLTASGVVQDGNSGENYQLNFVSALGQINPRVLTVSADAKSKAYGEADPPLTYALTDGSLLAGDNFSGGLARASGEGVGAYLINQGSLTVNSNYLINYLAANLVIGDGLALAVTADDKSINYGAPEPSFTFHYGTFVGADDASVIDSAPTCSVLGAHSEAGIYPIVCAGGVDNNYQFSYSSGTLTVNKINQTISFAAITDKVYGAADFELEASSDSALPLTFSASSDACVVSNKTVHILKAGLCSITAHQAGSNNYNPAADVSRSFNITKATATVTLGNLNQLYDSTAKQVTVSTTPPGLAVNLSYAASSTLPVTAGSYEVLAAINDANYLGSASGNLVIAKANLSINNLVANNKVYDGNALATLNFTNATLSGLRGEDAVTLDYSSALASFENKNVASSKRVVVSGLALSGASAANYNLLQPSLFASITKRDLLLMAVSDMKDYDGSVSSDKIPVLSSGELASGDSAIWKQVFASPESGVNKILIPSGVISDGNEGTNYNLNLLSSNTGIINERVVVVPVVSSGGGGAMVNNCKEIKFSDWGPCLGAWQSRTVLTRTPQSCQVSNSEQQSLQRACTPEKIIIEEKLEKVLGRKIYADGNFLKGSTVKIYWLIKGAKYHVKNLPELWSYHPKKVIRVEDLVLEPYPDRVSIK